ncbi:MAG TPA: chemotaxis protein CheX [Bacillota bacterium]|jgi:CheY-specific phosphatase CheX|nr:chemotaxis protein CheX [Bacillota bacterium]HOL11119.1 chemotaxis protein CheX [Bacillota bacterium]HPO97599.1 chemotaxis protein CheX [Bacillota bacterium]
MEKQEAIIQTISEMMPMFGVNADFQRALVSENLTSACQVNMLVGFTNSLKGNFLIGLDKNTALHIAGKMMGGMKLTEVDLMVKSALGELTNMIAGMFLNKLAIDGVVDLSPPTLITGDKLFIMISRVKSDRYIFKVNGQLLTVSYAIE